MKKWIFILILNLTISCNPDDNCGEIIDKVVEGNLNILVIRFDDGGSTSQNDFSGELVADIEVSEEIFSKYSEGETYCVE